MCNLVVNLCFKVNYLCFSPYSLNVEKTHYFYKDEPLNSSRVTDIVDEGLQEILKNIQEDSLDR